MQKLKVHYFQHVPFEGLGSIEDWISLNGHILTVTKLFEKADFPDISDIDWLIVMGGPMNVHSEDQFPWLKDEKKFIRKAIDTGKTVLGICLGSQLISAALGAKVYKNAENEIGWFDIELTSVAQSGGLFFDTGNKMKVFHWHGDTFDLPRNAALLASSACTKNQAYIYKDKVLALQFHLEPTLDSLMQMIEAGRDELKEGKYVQTEKEVLNNKMLIEPGRKILFTILSRLAERA